MRICRAMTVLLFILATAVAVCADAPGPAAWYKLDSPADLGQDASGNNVAARVVDAKATPGIHGGAIELFGDGGLEIANAPAFQAGQGFAVDLWVRFASVAENAGIVAKEGEYLLRLDPPNEGGRLSFFVNVDGSLEPRAYGIAPKPDAWYHIICTWDGDTASLWINGQQFKSQRRGAVAPTDAPVLIGLPSKFGPVGLKGAVDDVKLYSRALTDQEIMLAEYGLDALPQNLKATEPRFEFTAGLQGWEARDADNLHTAGGWLCATLRGGSALLLNRSLDVPIGSREFVSVRMSATAGDEAKLLVLTTDGLQIAPFALIGDGAMHSYVLRVSEWPNWTGNLRAIGLVPSNTACNVAVAFVRVSAKADAPPEIAVTSFYTDHAINRAGRACRIIAHIRNTGGPGEGLKARLVAPAGVKLVGAEKTLPPIGWSEAQDLAWDVEAPAAMTADFSVSVTGRNMPPAGGALQIAFTPPVNLPKADYVPEPVIPQSDYLVGAHYCPLWKQGSRGAGGWQEIVPFPERKPALGWYDEGDPEVTDWDIKWALEHGIQYFVYCWYRTNQGHGVQTSLSHAIHEGLFNAKYGSKFKFAIMWENQSKGSAGVASEKDLLETLLPYWIDNYFKRPNYLKIDNKPLLFIYRPEFLIDDLGNVENVRSAIGKMREVCKRAGFAGLTVLGEYRGVEPAPLKLMVDEGLDYGFQYCWPVGGQPTPDVAVKAQDSYMREWQRLNIIPGVMTASMGWDPRAWYTTDAYWRLPPADFKRVLENTKAFMATVPKDQLGSKMVLLDNWNEFGEGHYIAPHRQYGFGYLDAVRDVFTKSPGPHTDLVPEDIGLGPYDKLFRKALDREAQCAKVVTAPGGVPPGLIGWWTFDGPDDQTLTWDYSGHGLGGYIDNVKRVDSPHGKALDCSGGSVTIPKAGQRFGLAQITVECWVKTDLAGQNDKWFVNNLYDGGKGGFRLGLSGGKLCWAVPKSAWSHHLQATESLPLGRWVLVAATFDGQTMRIYMDGKECGSLARPGRVYADDWPLCLGSYEKGHQAYFTGQLADVRIYSRALKPEEMK
jgi:hypothetical protein